LNKNYGKKMEKKMNTTYSKRISRSFILASFFLSTSALSNAYGMDPAQEENAATVYTTTSLPGSPKRNPGRGHANSMQHPFGSSHNIHQDQEGDLSLRSRTLEEQVAELQTQLFELRSAQGSESKFSVGTRKTRASHATRTSSGTITREEAEGYLSKIETEHQETVQNLKNLIELGGKKIKEEQAKRKEERQKRKEVEAKLKSYEAATKSSIRLAYLLSSRIQNPELEYSKAQDFTKAMRFKKSPDALNKATHLLETLISAEIEKHNEWVKTYSKKVAEAATQSSLDRSQTLQENFRTSQSSFYTQVSQEIDAAQSAGIFSVSRRAQALTHAKSLLDQAEKEYNQLKKAYEILKEDKMSAQEKFSSQLKEEVSKFTQGSQKTPIDLEGLVEKERDESSTA
jgi:hypothetical protein